MRYRTRVLLLFALLPLALCSCASTRGTKRSANCDLPEPSLAMLKYGDDMCRYSPDGKYLCYRTTDRLYVVREDGRESECISIHISGLRGVPSWSPDGKRIAFCAGLPADLYTIGSDGQGLQKLGEYTYPEWSPDGKKIVALWHDLHWRESGIAILQSSDGIIVGNAEVDGDRFGPPAWSPDGDSIAFGVDGHLFITDGEGKNAKRITTRDHSYMDTRWASDGKRLAFATHRGTFVYDVEKEHAKRVIRCSAMEMAWSPDGECLLVVDSAPTVGLRTLYNMAVIAVNFSNASAFEYVDVAYLIKITPRRSKKFRYSDRVNEALARWPRAGS